MSDYGTESASWSQMHRARAATWLALCCLAVNAWCPWLYSGVLLPKRLAFHALAGLMVLVAAPNRRRVILASLASVCILAAALASGAFVSTLPRALDDLALLWLLLSIASTRIPVRVIVAGLVGSAVAPALVGLLEQWVELPWLLEATRPASFFGGRNAAGEFVAAVIPLAAAAPLGRMGKLRPLALGILTAFVVTTRCRAAWVGLALGLCLAVLRMDWRRRIMALAPVALAAGLAAAATPGPQIHWRAKSPYADSLRSIRPAALHGRLVTWANAMAMIAAHPLLGVGPGRFRATYPEYSQATAPDPSYSVDIQIEEPHNEALRFVCELGIPGALLFALAASPRRRAGRSSVRTLGLVGGALALFPPAMVSVTFLSPAACVAAAICLGLLDRARLPRRPSARARPSHFVPSAVVLVAVLAIDVAEVVSSRFMLLGERALASGALRSAAEQFAWATLCCGATPAQLRLAEVAAQSGDTRRCREVARQILASDPLSLHALHFRARCSEEMGDLAEAAAAYKRALSILPTDPIARFGLRQLSSGAQEGDQP